VAKEVPFNPNRLMEAARAAQNQVTSAMDEYRLPNDGYRTDNLPAPTFSQLPPDLQRRVASAMYLATNPIFDSRTTFGVEKPRYYPALAGGLDWRTVLQARTDGRLDDKLRPVGNLLSAEEAAALGQAGIDSANIASEGDPNNPATLGLIDGDSVDLNAMVPGYDTPMPTRTEASPISRPASGLYRLVQRAMMAQQAGLNAEEARRFMSARSHYSPGGVFNATESERGSWMMQNYPSLALTAQQEGWSAEEVAKTTNFALAQDTAMKVLAEPDEYRARQMLASIPAGQKSLVYDLIGQISRDIDRQRRLQEKTTYDDPLLIEGGKFLWNMPMGPGTMINALNWAWEQGQHVGRTFLYGLENYGMAGAWAVAGTAASTGLPNPGAIAVAAPLLADAWSKTEHGQFDTQMLTDAVTKYGPKQVEVAQAAVDARLDGGTEAYVTLLDKYQDDPEARAILAHVFSDVNTDEQYQDLVKDVTAANNANYGNLAGRLVGFDPTSDFSIGIGDINPFELTRDVSNVVGAFTLDPTLAAGAAGKAINGVRYGVYLLMNEERLARTLTSPATTKLGKVADAFSGRTSVRRYFDWMGGELERVRNLKGLERGNALTTLRSQSSKYIPADALESMLKFGVKDSASAYEWLQGAENLMSIMRGQSAKHLGSVRAPHMSAAGRVAKEVSLQTRRLDPTKVIARKAQQELVTVFGDDFVDLPADQQLSRFVEVIQDEDQAMRIASAVSDLRNVDSGGVRTTIGRLVDALSRNRAVAPEWTQRYGWKRKKGGSVFGAFQVRSERLSRMLARMPDTTGGIRTDTAVDADKVYEMMRLAGVPRYWASYFRAAWVDMSQAQRRLSMIGLVRTFGIASGVDLVAPEQGMRELVEGISGLRVMEKYAPNVAKRMPHIAARAENDVDSALGKRPVGMSSAEAEAWDGTRAAMIESRRAELIREEGIDLIEPDTMNGIASAVWWGQTRDRMALPNFQAIDRIRARQSYMGSLFMRNKVGQNVTDLWTIALLAGPRFSIRNGIEDFTFYALTGGSMREFWRGRQASTAVREATMRNNIDIVRARTELDDAKSALESMRLSGGATDNQIEQLERTVNAKQREVDRLRGQMRVRGQKLGIVKTAMRNLGDRLPVMQRFILPHLTADEIYDAAKASEAGDRQALADLVVKAFLRQKLLFIKDNDAKILSERLSKGAARDDLSPRMKQIMDDLDDFVMSTHVTALMDEVAETSRHLVDGTMQGTEDAANVVAHGRQMFRRVRFGDVQYYTQRVRNGSPAEVRAVIAGLHMALHSDGPKAQRAMKLLPEYFDALRQGDAGAAKANEIVDRLSDFIGSSPEGYDYASRFGLAAQPDVTRLARSTMDTLTGMFTTADGSFNDDLYRALRVPGSDPEFPTFRVHFTDADGNQIDNVTLADFAEGVIPLPQYTLMRQTDSILVPEKMPWQDTVWSMMGRSLARMTREPIYIANYLESRQALRPLEQRLIKIGFSEDRAKVMVAELAGDRAMNLAMSYVDNPSVRSQMAWALRNVARFYRAQEDFIRRMWRTAQNNPMAFWKATLGWNAAQNSGFVHTDQYGEPYFIYPGSRSAIEAVTKIADTVFPGTDMSMISSVPMNFTGKLNWVTPSADPESWAPTLSSPWASVSLRPLLRSLPLTSEVERNLFGAIGEDKSVVDTIIPPNVNRAVSVLTTITNTRDASQLQFLGNTMAANAARKAMLMIAATGQMPTDGPMSDGERAQWADRIDKIAAGTLILQFALGLMVPASPQLSTDDVTKFARELGMDGLRPQFVSMLANMRPDETVEDVQIRWLQDYGLDAAIYMESESKSADKGYWAPTEDNAKFMTENEDLMRTMPVAASYFSPGTGNETFLAYKTISGFGVREKMMPMEFLQALTEAKGNALLDIWRMDTQNLLKAAKDQDEADLILAGMREQKRDILANYGISGENNPGWSSPSDFDNRWGEIVSAGNTLAERGNPIAIEMRPFFAAVAAKRDEVDRLKDSIDPDATKRLSEIKDGWYAMVLDAMKEYGNDERYVNILKAGTYYIWPDSGSRWPWELTEVNASGL